jgi:hypothetical protein
MDHQTYSLYNQQMWMMQQRQYAMGLHQVGINPNAGVPMGMSGNLVPNGMYYPQTTQIMEVYPPSNYAASTSAQSVGDDVHYETSSSAMDTSKPKRKIRKRAKKVEEDSESDFFPELEAPIKPSARPRRSTSTQKKSPTPEEAETMDTLKIEEDVYVDPIEDETPMASSSESEAVTPKPKRVRKKAKAKVPATPQPALANGKTHLTPNGILKIRVGNVSLYVCDVCQKTFKQNGHMRRHKRLHGGEDTKVHGMFFTTEY